MLKHKNNCTENLVIVQYRWLQGDNGDRRTLHRLYCPNCKNNKTVSAEEALEVYNAQTETQERNAT